MKYATVTIQHGSDGFRLYVYKDDEGETVDITEEEALSLKFIGIPMTTPAMLAITRLVN